MLQISSDGLKSHIFPGNRCNAADRRTDAPPYDFSCWGRMLTLSKQLTADRSIGRAYTDYVRQEPMRESPHAASMPRRNGGVLNAFDLSTRKINSGESRMVGMHHSGNKKNCLPSRYKWVWIPVSTILASSTAASRDQQGSQPTRISVPRFFLGYG